MFLNEVLHKAKALGKDFMVLKLNAIKAFNCMSWEFLVLLLE